MARVIVWLHNTGNRARVITRAWAAGIAAVEGADRVEVREVQHYAGKSDAPACVFYGYGSKLPEIMREMRATGRAAVYVDLGYWGRKLGGNWAGYHKVSINARHPTEYFRRRQHPADRFDAQRVPILPWTEGRSAILVAGMGPKAAAVEHLATERWERDVIADLRRRTDRPIIYRPKPSHPNPQPIKGTRFSASDPKKKAEPLERVLAECYAVVTHHSNTAVDGLLAGVPAFVWGGVAAPLGLADLALLETPARPEGRREWAADVAYCQFNINEMTQGLAWRHLRDEGLVSP